MGEAEAIDEGCAGWLPTKPLSPHGGSGAQGIHVASQAPIKLVQSVPRQTSGPGLASALTNPTPTARAPWPPATHRPASSLLNMNAAHMAARPLAACPAAAPLARRSVAPSALLAAPAPCHTPCCFRQAALQPARGASGSRRRQLAAAPPRAEQPGGNGEVKVCWAGCCGSAPHKRSVHGVAGVVLPTCSVLPGSVGFRRCPPMRPWLCLHASPHLHPPLPHPTLPQRNTEFGYSRKDVILIGGGLIGAGYAMYYGLQVQAGRPLAGAGSKWP